MALPSFGAVPGCAGILATATQEAKQVRPDDRGAADRRRPGGILPAMPPGRRRSAAPRSSGLTCFASCVAVARMPAHPGTAPKEGRAMANESETGDPYQFEFAALGDGGALPLAAWRGKPVLVVNVASYCGYTPQYRDLEALWRRYR